MLTGMGFSANAARKALILCGGNTEQAMDWILEHAGDAGLDEPITEAEIAAAAARQRNRAGRRQPRQRPQFMPDQDVAARLVDMGFAADQVAEALRVTRNDENAAVAYLLGEGPRAAPVKISERKEKKEMFVETQFVFKQEAAEEGNIRKKNFASFFFFFVFFHEPFSSR